MGKKTKKWKIGLIIGFIIGLSISIGIPFIGDFNSRIYYCYLEKIKDLPPSGSPYPIERPEITEANRYCSEDTWFGKLQKIDGMLHLGINYFAIPDSPNLHIPILTIILWSLIGSIIGLIFDNFKKIKRMF